MVTLVQTYSTKAQKQTPEEFTCEWAWFELFAALRRNTAYDQVCY